MALLALRNVTKLYQTESASVVAVHDVSLEVNSGEFVALVGRSGCGKSTLLNLSGAMDLPTRGEVFLDGRITSKLTDAELTLLRRRSIGFIFQSFQLLNTLSAVENVELPLLLGGEKKARKRALKSLSWVDLAGHANRLPHQLSGGEQQRVAVARALVHEPILLLADEPTGNLDSATGETVLSLLERAAHQHGVAVIMATHSTDCASLADQIVSMRDGHLESITLTHLEATR